MGNIHDSMPEKHPVDPEGTAVGKGSKEETHSEPDRNGIYLDYGPLLPDSYHQDIIVALIRDPECIFCYWELSGEVARKVAADFSLRNPASARWILRVHNLSHMSFNDIVIATPQNYSPPEAPARRRGLAEGGRSGASLGSAAGDNIQGNYYLTTLPATKYQLELGVSTADNEFISLVKSNIVTTPRRNKAPMSDAVFSCFPVPSADPP